MTHIRLFLDLIYHGIRARVYLWARNYCERYERSKPPLTILGGGQEWPVNRRRVNVRIRDVKPAEFVYIDDDLIHTCGDCGQHLTIVRPGKYQCDNPHCPSLIENMLAEAAEEGWPM